MPSLVIRTVNDVVLLASVVQRVDNAVPQMTEQALVLCIQWILICLPGLLAFHCLQLISMIHYNLIFLCVNLKTLAECVCLSHSYTVRPSLDVFPIDLHWSWSCATWCRCYLKLSKLSLHLVPCLSSFHVCPLGRPEGEANCPAICRFFLLFVHSSHVYQTGSKTTYCII